MHPSYDIIATVQGELKMHCISIVQIDLKWNGKMNQLGIGVVQLNRLMSQVLQSWLPDLGFSSQIGILKNSCILISHKYTILFRFWKCLPNCEIPSIVNCIVGVMSCSQGRPITASAWLGRAKPNCCSKMLTKDKYTYWVVLALHNKKVLD